MTSNGLLRDPEAEKSDRVGFIELFFDLGFVFAVTQLAHRLVEYAPANLRHVPLARYTGQALADFCSGLAIDLPTFDIPGNKEKFGLK